jgi:DNA-binding NarL/FixJ family response regulator
MIQLLKNTPNKQMANSIGAVLQGHAPEAKVEGVASWQKHFTARECEILMQLAQGKNNREIAQTLYLTEGTVKNYITRILGHLELRNRTQIALWAQRQLLYLRESADR